MFTGVIQEVGKVIDTNFAQDFLKIKIWGKKLNSSKIGESVAINGVCLTITKITKPDIYEFDIIQETLQKTNLQNLQKNSPVNIEKALKLNQGIDGHLVLGHVDFSGKIKKINRRGKNTSLQIGMPAKFRKYITYKGSVTINGVSLTVSKAFKNHFAVELIPYTLKNTNLGNLNINDKVNIEIDIIARYLENLISHHENH